MKVSVVKSASSSKSKNLILFSAISEGKKSKNLVLSSKIKSILDLATTDMEEETFKSTIGSSSLYRHTQVDNFQNVLLLGLGEKKNITAESFRLAGGHLYKMLSQLNYKNAVLDLSQLNAICSKNIFSIQAFVEGLGFTSYKLCEHKTKGKSEFDLKLEIATTKGAKANKEVKTALSIVDSVNFAKRLGDLPGNKMNPVILAKEVQKATKGTKIKTTVWDKARIKKENFGGLYGVSLGSGVEPRFIIMEYKGAAASKKPVFLVGKGLTFDSGGISLKPSPSMDEMKYDMCGGTNVIGAMLAIEKLKLKANVTALIPSSENMSGEFATRPGDILTLRNKKTVEVLNTDAEGRLILADALSYAAEKKPAVILDMATLTGAMLMALGNIHAGIFSNDDQLVKKIQNAARSTEEKVWHMPLTEEHSSDIKGTFADLLNIGKTRGAGSATAAAFLKEFVSDIPWAHFDIAGTAWNAGDRKSYCPPKGATGSMIRTLVEFVSTF